MERLRESCVRGKCEIGHTQCERDTLSGTHSEPLCISETHTTNWDGNITMGIVCIYMCVCLSTLTLIVALMALYILISKFEETGMRA